MTPRLTATSCDAERIFRNSSHLWQPPDWLSCLPICCAPAAGAACNALMVVWQALACFALPSALVYASEKRSRRIFLETVSD